VSAALITRVTIQKYLTYSFNIRQIQYEISYPASRHPRGRAASVPLIAFRAIYRFNMSLTC